MAGKNTGGAAFPLSRESSMSKNYEGMTLRDYFAGQALQGIIASGIFVDPDGLFTGNAAPVMAEAAYLLADAMIAERERAS